MAKSEEEKAADAVSTIIAGVILGGLVGLAAWAFGMPPKFSLGIAILGFFVFLYEV